MEKLELDTQPKEPSDEALEIQKEIFMTSGGLKIGQSMTEYKAEREALWDKMHPQKKEETETVVSKPILDSQDDSQTVNVVEKNEIERQDNLKKVRKELGLEDQNKKQESLRDKKLVTPEADLDLQRQTIEFVEQEILPVDQPVSVSEFYNKLNNKFPFSFLYSGLAKVADDLGIKICRTKTFGGSNSFAVFDYQTNTIKIETEKNIGYKGKMNSEILAFRVMAHEIVHAIIHNKFPKWDFQKGSAPDSRKNIDSTLQDLVRSLEKFRGQTGNERTDKIIEIIISAKRSPEEIVTYSLADGDFNEFMKRTNQMDKIIQFLNDNGLGELEQLLK